MFRSGSIRLGLLEYYRTSEDPQRRNPRDGLFSGYVTSGEKAGFHTFSALTFAYILSFSIPDERSTISGYGDHYIRVASYDLLFARLKDALNPENLHSYSHRAIQYTESIPNVPSYGEVYFSNARTHASNREYRFLFQLKDVSPEAYSNDIQFSEQSTKCAATIQIPSFVTVSNIQISDLIVPS